MVSTSLLSHIIFPT